MSHTFIVAEAGSSHDNDLAKAYRLIEAAKECGADAVKFQWTSSGKKMGFRRGLNCAGYIHYLEKPESWLYSLKQHADKVGIEFMCTAYLIEDIATIAPLVKRFKVSAFESEWKEFVEAHGKDREVIVSRNTLPGMELQYTHQPYKYLYCVSQYPTPLEELHLSNLEHYYHHDYEAHGVERYDGLSDHTTSTLTGALAVAAGATIIEKHIRLHDTSKDCPDYPHSLVADEFVEYADHTYTKDVSAFWRYVSNIREAERCM